LDPLSLLEFLFILALFLLLPPLWLILRGEKAGDPEGELWERMKREETDAPRAEGGPYAPSRTTATRYLSFLIWRYGWRHRDWRYYEKRIKESRRGD
jgi:hypothetical protein